MKSNTSIQGKKIANTMGEKVNSSGGHISYKTRMHAKYPLRPTVPTYNLYNYQQDDQSAMKDAQTVVNRVRNEHRKGCFRQLLISTFRVLLIAVITIIIWYLWYISPYLHLHH